MSLLLSYTLLFRHLRTLFAFLIPHAVFYAVSPVICRCARPPNLSTGPPPTLLFSLCQPWLLPPTVATLFLLFFFFLPSSILQPRLLPPSFALFFTLYPFYITASLATLSFSSLTLPTTFLILYGFSLFLLQASSSYFIFLLNFYPLRGLNFSFFSSFLSFFFSFLVFLSSPCLLLYYGLVYCLFLFYSLLYSIPTLLRGYSAPLYSLIRFFPSLLFLISPEPPPLLFSLLYHGPACYYIQLLSLNFAISV